MGKQRGTDMVKQRGTGGPVWSVRSLGGPRLPAREMLALNMTLHTFFLYAFVRPGTSVWPDGLAVVAYIVMAYTRYLGVARRARGGVARETDRRRSDAVIY